MRVPTPLHFLHIRKTGGTAVKHALKGASTSRPIVLHTHEVRLMDIPVGEPVFFFLRDPVARFVSGFNSRLRQGRPRHDHPWNDAEREAFANFHTPEALASALCSHDTALRGSAEQAMRDIRHISSRYRDWLGDEAYLNARRTDLFFIGFQETLEPDFAQLKQRLGLPDDVRLPCDDVAAHRTPLHFDRQLSTASIGALREWYAEDERLLRFCKSLAVR